MNTTIQDTTQDILLSRDNMDYVREAKYSDIYREARYLHPEGGVVHVVLYKVPDNEIGNLHGHANIILRDRDNDLVKYKVAEYEGYIEEWRK